MPEPDPAPAKAAGSVAGDAAAAGDQPVNLGRLRQHMLERVPLNAAHRFSVLMPLVAVNGEWNLLFEIRSGKIRQGGEICFPGGGIEAGETPRQAALRETGEELLLPEENIDLLCPMLQITGPRGADVYSYLGILKAYDGTFSEDEVACVATLPLTWFEDHPAREYAAEMKMNLPEDFPYQEIPGGRNYPFYSIPKMYYFYATPFGTLWGMTAQLVHDGLPIILRK